MKLSWLKAALQRLRYWLAGRCRTMAESDRETLRQQLAKLGQTLGSETQSANAHLATRCRNAISYSDPDTRQRIQSDLNHAVGLFSVAHVMTVLELGFPPHCWDELLDQEDILTLHALQHLRASAGNGLSGLRAKECHEQFDAVMASKDPIRGVKSFDNAKVRLEEQVGMYAATTLQQIVNKALVRAHAST